MIQLNVLFSATICLLFVRSLWIEYNSSDITEQKYAAISWLIGIANCAVSMLFILGNDYWGYGELSGKITYITGPILGFLPLSIGIMFRTFSKKTVQYTTFIFALFCINNIVMIVLSPYNEELVSNSRVIGNAFEWAWIRKSMRYINSIAGLAYTLSLIIWVRNNTYLRVSDVRFWGGILLFLGAILLSINGFLIHKNFDQLLGYFEIIGFAALYAGYYYAFSFQPKLSRAANDI